MKTNNFPFSLGASMNFTNLPKHSTDIKDYADQRNPELNVKLAKQLNAQADRLELLFLDILTSPKHQEIEYKDILPWRQRVSYLKSQGQGRAAKRIAIAEAAIEAKQADSDEEFMTGYKEFLDSEFIVS